MTTIRNRKKEYRTVKGRDILPNPSNWRKHPDYQRAAMEIEPRYADVAIRRWEDYTGQKAELVGAG